MDELENVMRPILSTLCAASLLAAATTVAAADIDVMTQNQYLGADLAPVLGAASAVPFDPVAFNGAVVEALTKIAAARPAERVQALAAGIAQRHPDVVGLQEAFKFECVPMWPGQPSGQGCDHPALKAAFTDQLSGTLGALRGRYELAGKATQLKLELPNGIPFTTDGVNYAMLGLADRDAILVRSGVPYSTVQVPGCRVSDAGCNYKMTEVGGPPTLTLPNGQKIVIERGFLAVDVTVRGKGYRIFNTHLEQRQLADNLPQTRVFQVLQASELLQSVLQSMPGDRRVLLMGDFNSDPADPPIGTSPTPYMIFAGMGFTDTWTMRPQSDEGLSCCQSETLTNRKSELSERIDLIFSLTRPSRVVDMKLLGTTMGDKTRPPGNGGLWPSDHAAVAAKLFFD
jgi:Endonuclease/Exonuclease/phosphatase family